MNFSTFFFSANFFIFNLFCIPRSSTSSARKLLSAEANNTEDRPCNRPTPTSSLRGFTLGGYRWRQGAARHYSRLHPPSAVPGCYDGNNPYPGTVDGRWLARSSTVNFKYELTSHQQSLGWRFVREKYLLETNDLQPITVVSYRLLHINLTYASISVSFDVSGNLPPLATPLTKPPLNEILVFLTFIFVNPFH